MLRQWVILTHLEVGKLQNSNSRSWRKAWHHNQGRKFQINWIRQQVKPAGQKQNSGSFLKIIQKRLGNMPAIPHVHASWVAKMMIYRLQASFLQTKPYPNSTWTLKNLVANRIKAVKQCRSIQTRPKSSGKLKQSGNTMRIPLRWQWPMEIPRSQNHFSWSSQ